MGAKLVVSDAHEGLKGAAAAAEAEPSVAERRLLRPSWPGHVWAYDFVQDRTSDGQPFRMLAVIDNYTCECLAIAVARPATEVAERCTSPRTPTLATSLRRC
jgi:transposase InsO family protein